MVELLFDVQIGGIFELFLEESDLAGVAFSCHFALDFENDKARLIILLDATLGTTPP